ncbi:MAG: hypothetical protein ACRCTP_17785 [Aeromonas popoffii]|uniref:hypothetical protein n=1 Tax=Aeromonas popoffii TaxID=70856 RepID=UPI003F2CCB84
MLKFILWSAVIGAVIALFKALGQGFVWCVTEALDAPGRIRKEKADRAASTAMMREHYINQAIFLRVMVDCRSEHNERQVALSKSDGRAIHNARVRAAMEKAEKDLTPQQIAALGL